jgi:hypothetical protein
MMRARMLVIGCVKARETPQETALERRKATSSSVMNMLASTVGFRRQAERCCGALR